jgi:hypothetical protein
MPQKYSLVLFFNPEKLDAPQRFDATARRSFLHREIQAICRTLSGVEIGEPLVSSFSVPANVTADQLPVILELMNENERGEVFYDGEILQAAK